MFSDTKLKRGILVLTVFFLFAIIKAEYSWFAWFNQAAFFRSDASSGMISTTCPGIPYASIIIFT
jgi:hypothetical protein